MDRSQRLTDGTKRRTCMRFLLLDDLMTSYTNARPGAGLRVVDLDLPVRAVGEWKSNGPGSFSHTDP